MQNHPYEIIALNEKARNEFYQLCEKRITLLKQHGFIAEAILHAKSLRSIQADLNELAQFG
ncbi:hypothetical protein [Rhizobium sp. BK661]|uniref:hypothetical protein n=1 Tax=Rhizobium sp. BK661 TaxID=2586991 RepID=UPI00216A0BE5|nr:hypothetical protein [Rhizobium sp. BK661]MCS3743813.1 hypothetical protein [Rhizobium sp. BK661]